MNKMNNKNQKTEEEWKEELTEEEYKVLREGGTERRFSGKYWDSNEKGMYTCRACGNKLFSSNAKFDSKSGWPSFDKPLEDGNIELKEDRSHGMVRTEVVCGHCGSHLGHVFEDGPTDTGKRYCINSVCLDLEEE